MVCGEEYLAMENMVNVLTDVVKRTAQYSLMTEEFEIDQMINEACSDREEEAVLAFYGVSQEDFDAWCEKNAEVAHWVSEAARSASASFPDLDDFVNEYEPE